MKWNSPYFFHTKVIGKICFLKNISESCSRPKSYGPVYNYRSFSTSKACQHFYITRLPIYRHLPPLTTLIREAISIALLGGIYTIRVELLLVLVNDIQLAAVFRWRGYLINSHYIKEFITFAGWILRGKYTSEICESWFHHNKQVFSICLWLNENVIHIRGILGCPFHHTNWIFGKPFMI